MSILHSSARPSGASRRSSEEGCEKHCLRGAAQYIVHRATKARLRYEVATSPFTMFKSGARFVKEIKEIKLKIFSKWRALTDVYRQTNNIRQRH